MEGQPQSFSGHPHGAAGHCSPRDVTLIPGFAIFWLILLYMYRKGTFLRV
jgi:hypothetical protein